MISRCNIANRCWRSCERTTVHWRKWTWTTSVVFPNSCSATSSTRSRTTTSASSFLPATPTWDSSETHLTSISIPLWWIICDVVFCIPHDQHCPSKVDTIFFSWVISRSPPCALSSKRTPKSNPSGGSLWYCTDHAYLQISKHACMSKCKSPTPLAASRTTEWVQTQWRTSSSRLPALTMGSLSFVVQRKPRSRPVIALAISIVNVVLHFAVMYRPKTQKAGMKIYKLLQP